MLKHIQAWDITKAVNNEKKLFVGSFAWASHVSLKTILNTSSLTVTNDLLSEKLAELIATSMLLLAQNITTVYRPVSVSNILQHNDRCSNKM